MLLLARKAFKKVEAIKWLSSAVLVLVFLLAPLADAASTSMSVTILPAKSAEQIHQELLVQQQQHQQEVQQQMGLSIVIKHSISVGGGGGGGKYKNKNKNKNKGPKAPSSSPAPAGPGPSGPSIAAGANASGPKGPEPKGPGVSGPNLNPGPNVTAGVSVAPPKPPQAGVKNFSPVLSETKTMIHQAIQNVPNVSEEKVQHIVELKQEGFKNIKEIKSVIQGVLDEKKAYHQSVASENQSASSALSVALDSSTASFSSSTNSSVSESAPVEDELDYEDHWAETYIEVVKVMELAEGKDEEGNFEPNEAITRAEFVKMTINAMGYEVSDTVTESPFVDVDVEDWHAPYLSVAKQVGVIDGFEDGSFEPNRQVTRAEVMKVLILGVMDIEMEYEEGEDVLEKFGLVRKPFVDLSVEKWYAPYVLYSSEIGLVNGYSDYTFRPNEYMTRAELSKVLVETLEQVYSEDGRLSLLEPLQLSEEGLENQAGRGVDSDHDISLWERIRRWAF